VSRDGFFNMNPRNTFPNEDGLVDDVAIDRALDGDGTVLDAMNRVERCILLAVLASRYNNQFRRYPGRKTWPDSSPLVQLAGSYDMSVEYLNERILAELKDNRYHKYLLAS
jgi:hypothetical protein